MKREHLQYLICPECRTDLQLADGYALTGDSIETGALSCAKCAARYPIVRHIPRFTPLENYASSFGFEWHKHARTQYDSYSGANISETRFFNETKWARQLPGERILEVGSGSGRFTEQAASTGAMVCSLDYSVAVEANYASNGGKPNVLIVQGDLYKMPFREGTFDKVLCIGVIQHTPDVEKSFFTLARFTKPGGRLTVDVYKRNDTLRGYIGKLFATKYWVRPLTRRVAPHELYGYVVRYINFMWPIARVINKLGGFGRWLNWRLLVADYRGVFALSDEMLKEWAILDTFDMVSPHFDQPQTRETLRDWFERAGMKEIEVHFGYNGIEGRGQRPHSSSAST